MANTIRPGIVVVFYRPDADCVRRANRYAQYGHAIVVDNTESVSAAAELGLDPRITYIANGHNLGIGAAINQGVQRAIDKGCANALIFDQDSDPTGELLEGLPKLLDAAVACGQSVAVVGPAYDDVRLGGIAPFVRFGYVKLLRIMPVGEELIDVDFLISSGSCLNLAAWQAVGPMEEDLFIDFVDLEWCIRARSKGYAVLGAPQLRLAHELGGEPVKVFGRPYPSHSPLRHYYLFRNAVALIQRRYVPWSWKSTELVKFPFRLAIYGLFLRPRLGHLRMAVLGIWHGLTGRMGAL
ncbi:glycosyltransferase family 2 protein [Paraburkholderia metrosideri]|uniref:Glycosyltransferase 2-like domain-containing protein n=1 Tax=Paraburkholderia metrosideri TaxID=580937 RepID=A0ABM8NGR4_9BURK|nr:glycosyltransferase family 2 protein [Paraburkholderia metrosideri]CAD6524481.1 hypothetical protein LMG28140_01624 [Paraburkholderia metrosideri]